jgi:CRP/FNR family transcriptional regulator, cyclic AMP receptor protein
MTRPQSFVHFLLTSPFFAGLGHDAIQAIAALCTTRHLARAEVLFLKGEPGDALYALRRGQVRIATSMDDGRHVTLNILGSGDVFGEIALLDGQPRTADAIALEPCELFVVQRRDFLALLEREPSLAIRVIEFLCVRLRWMSMRMEEATLLPVEVRLARRLLMLAQDYGSQVQVSQQELASFVGAARESVNRQLQLWQQSGLVALGRCRINILDVNRLARLGNQWDGSAN